MAAWSGLLVAAKPYKGNTEGATSGQAEESRGERPGLGKRNAIRLEVDLAAEGADGCDESGAEQQDAGGLRYARPGRKVGVNDTVVPINAEGVNRIDQSVGSIAPLSVLD